MAKSKAKSDTAFEQRAEQLSLPFMISKSFEYPAGSYRRAEAVREAVSLTLKDCQKRGLTRNIIADEMTRLVGQTVSKSTVSNWGPDSKSGYRLPLEWAAAFSIVTNDNRAIKAAFSGTGINVLDDTEMIYYEIGKAEEIKREQAAKQKVHRNMLKERKMQGKI